MRLTMIPDMNLECSTPSGICAKKGNFIRTRKPNTTPFVRGFNENLEKPSRFTASKPPFYRKPNKAISWFKDTAHEHLGYVRELVGTVQNHGVLVQTLTTDRVGYVVYEDDFQTAAEAFAGERYC